MDVDRITTLGIFMVSKVSSLFFSDEPIPEDWTMHVLHKCQFGPTTDSRHSWWHDAIVVAIIATGSAVILMLLHFCFAKYYSVAAHVDDNGGDGDDETDYRFIQSTVYIESPFANNVQHTKIWFSYVNLNLLQTSGIFFSVSLSLSLTTSLLRISFDSIPFSFLEKPA